MSFGLYRPPEWRETALGKLNMRYNFDVPEKEEQQPRAPSPATPKEEVQWLPLQNHPIFTTATATAASTGHPSAHRTARNLMAWDGASRLYFWDSVKKCLHRISIRLGEPDPTSVLADSPSKVSSIFVSVFSLIGTFLLFPNAFVWLEILGKGKKMKL